MYYWYGHMWFGGLWMIIFLGLVIWLIVWLVNNYSKTQQNSEQDSAIEILKKRFAKGDITKKEFESVKKEIAKR